MIFLYVIGGIVLLVGGFFALATIMESSAKKKAPMKLEKAQKLFSDGEQQKALEQLGDAFFVPTDNTFDLETAQLALNVLELFKKILSDMRVTDTDSVDALSAELWKISSGEKEISETLTKPVEKLFTTLIFKSGNNVDDLQKLIREGKLEVREKESPEDFTTRLPSEFDSSVNQVGRLLMKGKTEDAILLLNPLVSSDNMDVRATFLEQRGACYTMIKEYSKAIDDYNEIHKLFPGHVRTIENIRDVEKEMRK